MVIHSKYQIIGIDRLIQIVIHIQIEIVKKIHETPQNHSGSSGGWEERTKLREKVTLKFTSPTLPIMPTAVTIKLMKLGSCNFT